MLGFRDDDYACACVCVCVGLFEWNDFLEDDNSVCGMILENDFMTRSLLLWTMIVCVRVKWTLKMNLSPHVQVSRWLLCVHMRKWTLKLIFGPQVMFLDDDSVCMCVKLTLENDFLCVMCVRSNYPWLILLCNPYSTFVDVFCGGMKLNELSMCACVFKWSLADSTFNQWICDKRQRMFWAVGILWDELQSGGLFQEAPQPTQHHCFQQCHQLGRDVLHNTTHWSLSGRCISWKILHNCLVFHHICYCKFSWFSYA